MNRPSESETETETAAPASRRLASGIYGAIITAALLEALPATLTTFTTAVAVVLTLIVYWLAEQYAEALAGQVHDGRLPTWGSIRGALASTWPLVSSSFLPLLALLIARVSGATALEAADIAMTTAILLLATHAWRAARAAQLRTWRLILATAIAGALGLMMVVLKDLVLEHLH
ncbi:MAG: hypothetical protein ACJ74U_13925 [Jatrophihabitantaceae bacterium]